MIINQSTRNDRPSANGLIPTIHFSMALLYASLRNVKTLAITLGMPLFMLFTIWIPVMAGDEESLEIMYILFPAIILLSVIMPGMTQATRLTRWKEQNIFQRLALTPVPLANFMVGTACTQILIGVGQGILIMLFGTLIVGLHMSLLSVLLVIGSMVLAAAAFIAFGSMIAALCNKADIAGYVYFFSIMPLTFLASFPPEMMPNTLTRVTPWLPTSMAIELIGPMFLNNRISDGAMLACMGLLIYSILLVAISVRGFQWKA